MFKRLKLFSIGKKDTMLAVAQGGQSKSHEHMRAKLLLAALAHDNQQIILSQ